MKPPSCPRKPSKDVEAILALLETAHANLEPLAVTLADRLAANRHSLRERRKMSRMAFRFRTHEMRTYVRESSERACRRLLNDNKRLRALRARYASLQTPVYWYLPTAKETTTHDHASQMD
jgi:hypothetical protein